MTGNDHFPSVPARETSAKGGAIRAARRQAGMDVGTAARQLKIAAPRLVQIELGQHVFTDPGDYARAAHNIRTGAARRDSERRGT